MTPNLILRIANFVLLAVNIALFCLWFSLVRVDVVHVNTDAANYILSEVSAQVTALGVIVTFGALLLAALGIFGFQAVLERAENRAESVARKLIAQKFDDLVRQYNPAAMRVNVGPMEASTTETQDAREIRGL